MDVNEYRKRGKDQISLLFCVMQSLIFKIDIMCV